jgi:hypothetical protein
MNPKLLLALWLARIITHGLAWAIAFKLGFDAADAQSHADAIAQAFAGVFLAIASAGSSLAERKHLLKTTPPPTGK